MKEYTITMTSKGQFTMPVSVRKALGLNQYSNTLKLLYNPATKIAKIEKPLTIDEIKARARRHIKPGTPPLLDAHAFFDTREAKK